MSTWIVPKLIRLRDVADYLGMDRNRFNVEVRPDLTEIPIGSQGVAFDRVDLDAWADEYKAVRGRPPEKEDICLEKECQGSSSEVKPGTSTSKLRDMGGFARAAARVISEKRKST